MTRHNSSNDTVRRIALGTFGCIVLAFGLAMLMVGISAGAEVGGDPVNVTNDTEEIVVDVDFNDSATDNATVQVLDNESYQAQGTLDTADYAGTLNGTVFELDQNASVHENATYAVALDQSATTVDVNSSDFDDDGTVDLSTLTDTSITADDTVTSVELTADTILEQTAEVDAGNTTTVSFDVVGNLSTGEYYVLVDGTEGDVDEVVVDTAGGGGLIADAEDTIGGMFGWLIGDNNPLFVAGGVVLIGGLGAVARRQGWLVQVVDRD